MGTRSKTSFIEKRGEEHIHLVSVYRQYDGYVEGMGHDLANYILDKEICNGIRLGRDTSKLANGFGCLIAQLIRDFKEDVGGLYIITENDIQEYNYDIIFDSDLYYGNNFKEELETNKYFKVRVTDWNEKIMFEGTLKELLEFKENEE